MEVAMCSRGIFQGCTAGTGSLFDNVVQNQSTLLGSFTCQYRGHENLANSALPSVPGTFSCLGRQGKFQAEQRFQSQGARWQCCTAGSNGHGTPGSGPDGPGGAGGKRGKSEKPIIGRAVGSFRSTAAEPLEENQGELEAWEKAPVSWEHYPVRHVAKGVVSLVAVERATSLAVEWGRLPFPAPVLMLAGIAAAMATNTEAGRQLYEFHAGAVAFFDAWLPMFFVPSVAGIALAPMPAGSDLLKAALLLGGSYAFNLWATGQIAVLVQGALKTTSWRSKSGRNTSNGALSISHEERAARISRAANAWAKSFAQKGAQAMANIAETTSEVDIKKAASAASELLSTLGDKIEIPKQLPPAPPLLSTASLLLGAALLLPFTLFSQSTTKMWMMSPGFLFLTIGLFTAAKGLPPQVKKWLSPTVVAGGTIAALTAVYGSSSLTSWQQGVRLYKEGAGAFLVMLIGPAVASLGFKVHTQRALLQKSATQLALVCLLIAPSGLLVTALIGRTLGTSVMVTASLLPATTTLGLAREMGPLLGANKGLLVAGVTIAGTAGISTARQLMAHWKIEGAVHRGMAVGASSHTLGASAIAVDEPQAAAVAGLALALKGTICVIAISIPQFRNLLLSIATPA